jgi:poly-gamma-glutamate synthesis protein (capsule biosynthesis protein)
MLIGRARAAFDRQGWEYSFGQVAPGLQAADLAFGNLEMPIYTAAERVPNFPEVCPDFYSPALTAPALKALGLDVVNLANNHMMDWGLAGLRETQSALWALGIKTIGAGENLAEARLPAIVEVNGARVGFLGYSEVGLWVAGADRPGVAPLDRQMILEDVSALKRQVELVIVSLHTGILSDYPSPEDRRLARDVIDQGANLVLGHGPHVVQGIEAYHPGAIVYSLGNFIIDVGSGNVENKTMVREHLDSVIVTAALAPLRRPEIEFQPIVVSDRYQVLPAEPVAADRIRARVARISNGLEHMSGLALWEHAGALNVEHQLRVMAFQWRHVSPGLVLNRLRKVRWRHLRLLVGYLLGWVKRAFRTNRAPEGSHSGG